MDNITIATSALLATRQNHGRSRHSHSPYLRHQRRGPAFAHWVSSLNPEYYIYYRVTGVHEFKVDAKIQTKLHLMPYLKIAHLPEAKPLFKEPFILLVSINQVKPHNQQWISVTATPRQFPRQTLCTDYLGTYFSDLESKILPKVPFPERVQDRNQDQNSGSFNVSPLRFYRFHLFFHQDKTYAKNYGIIDRMWDFNGHELQLSLPPDLDFGKPDIPATPQNHFLNPTKTAESDNLSQIDKDLQTFLKTYRSNVPLYKH